MLFCVHARDKPDVGPELDKLAEEHWSYMDRFADRLILRGPTLSEDGEEHTGSVHVVELDDLAAAQRFGTEEPFWRAGLYQDITTDRVIVLLNRDPSESSMSGEAPNAMVTARWPAKPLGAEQLESSVDERVDFVALLLDEDGSHTTGLIAIATTVPDASLEVVQPVADRLAAEPVSLSTRRWCRGGRR